MPAQGYKSVEIVQAYLLLTLWGCGAVERYEQDKTWLLLGMALRMATDLNLHRKTAVNSHDTAEGRARDLEVHNRERTWILCFCLDRSYSAQMGKPYSIREESVAKLFFFGRVCPNPFLVVLSSAMQTPGVLARRPSSLILRLPHTPYGYPCHNLIPHDSSQFRTCNESFRGVLTSCIPPRTTPRACKDPVTMCLSFRPSKPRLWQAQKDGQTSSLPVAVILVGILPLSSTHR